MSQLARFRAAEFAKACTTKDTKYHEGRARSFFFVSLRVLGG